MRFVKTVFRVLLQGIEILSRIIERYFTMASAIFLIAMWGLLLTNTVSRWIHVYTLGWTTEMVGYMVGWSIFIMMGPVAKSNMHIKVTFLPEKLLGEKRSLVYLGWIENMAGLSVAIYMSIHSYIWVSEAYTLDMQEQSIAGWWYPVYLLRSGIMIGFMSLAFVYFNRTVKGIVHLRSDLNPDTGIRAELRADAGHGMKASMGSDGT